MTYISDTLRYEVAERAADNCEYCLLNEQFTLKKHEIDHIRAEKHGGTTVSANLCLSCFECNRHKGSDLSGIDPITDDVIPLFHPRKDTWHEHFKILQIGTIEGITAKGRTTVKLLQFNQEERVMQRQNLILLGFISL